MEQSGVAIVDARVTSNLSTSETKAMDRTLVHGLAWTGVVKWLSQLLSWISTIVVARLLNPEDFGIVAMAGVFVGLIALFNEFGLGAAVVALRQLTDEQISSIHCLASLFGFGGFVVSCLIAIPAGAFYGASEVPLVIAIMGLGFFFLALRSVPSAVLEKALRFKLLAFLEGGQSITATVTTVGLAWWGVGYWALVVGGVVGHIAATAVIWGYHPIRYAWPSLRSLREALRFSSHVLAGRISWYVASNADVFIAGRILGQGVLGAYSFASTLANLPLDKISALLSRVMPAFYSSVQTDAAVLRRYLLLLTEGLALLTLPIGVGMALVADSFVPVVLGERWQGVVMPLQILSCWAVFRSIFNLIPPILYVTGGSGLAMRNGLFCLATYPVAFWIGSGWGAPGLALAWVVVQPLSWVAPYRHALRSIDLSFWRYLQALWPAASGMTIMGACVYGVGQILPGDWSAVLRLLCEVSVGVMTYAGATVLFHRVRIREFMSLVRNSQE
jgi:PST family polysaccharide transporter